MDLHAENEGGTSSLGRTTKSVYQQPSTGEKHVLFYSTSPNTSTHSGESHGKNGGTWSHNQQMASSCNIRSDLEITNNNSAEHQNLRMEKNVDTTAPTIVATSAELIRDQPTRCHQTIRVGICGWRKKCLYAFILALLFMVIVNLSLTLWVLKVMDFSPDGMGHLEVIPGGLRLKGNAFVLENLIASQIRSRKGDRIVVESSTNITLRSRSSNGYQSNYIHLGLDQFECLSNHFHILDDSGTLLFSADRNQVTLGTDTLRITGDGGSKFRGSIQAMLIRAESGHDLRLESPTRTMSIKGPKGVSIESRGGPIENIALNDIKFETYGGSIHLQSSVVVPHLPTAKVVPPHHHAASQQNQKNFDVFQLCACESGKLFLASPLDVCASSNDEGLC